MRAIATRFGRFVTTRRMALAGAFATGAALWLRCGALPPGLLDSEAAPSTIVLDRHGERLFEARSTLGLRGEPMDAAALPPVLRHATMAAEDVRFESHSGLDPIAIARAVVADMRAGQVIEGGSTITQQVAKLLIARQHRGVVQTGWRAKVREAVIAVRLEHRLSKDRILALYLDLAPYGNQIQGAARAAHAYFGRDVTTLTAAESAFLAALPQKPGRFNPWQTPARAIPRQQRILSTMEREGWLTATDAAHARVERIELGQDNTPLLAPHFVEHVLAGVSGTRPRQVRTTLDAGLQRTVEGIIAAEHASLAAHHASNVAVVVLDNASGDWLAWEGSGNYLDTDHGGAIDGAVSPRQPGSALKPFTYAAAFERGFDPGHSLPDVPSQFPTGEPGILYSPRNYDNRFRGPLLARAALAGSENVPAVAMASETGVPAIARLLRRAGLTTLDNNAAHYGLGLTLGNAEVRLDELVTAYATFARGGEFLPSRSVIAIDDRPQKASSIARVMSERTAFWITDVLSDAEARAYVFGRGGSLEFPFTVAAKTGTSQSYFDNWVVGYTRAVTVGVWVGNFDRTPLSGSSGVTGAGPIFHAVMLAAVERSSGQLPIGDTAPILSPPADLHRVELCAESGLVAGDACPSRVSEWVTADRDTTVCTWHHASDEGVVTVWPEVYREWARGEGRLDRRSDTMLDEVAAESSVRSAAGLRASAPGATSAPARSSSANKAGDSEHLTITRPLAGAVFLIDPTLRPEFQSLSFSARGGSTGALAWFVDGVPIGVVDPYGKAKPGGPQESVRWPLARGRHDVLVRDERGHSARTYIDVR